MNKTFKQILKKIKEYDTIVILRHEVPDFDASGSQFGLKTWIEDNFKNKKVYALGQTHKYFSPSLYPACDIAPENLNNYLCFVLDVSNKDRVDGKEYIDKASYTIKIDHHPNVENFANIEYVDDSTSAASENIVNMLATYKKTMSSKAAYYFYSAIVGDSGRFQYSSTSSKTFDAVSYLFKSKFDFEEIYEKMYMKSIKDINNIKKLYEIFKVTEKGVAYYHVSQEILDELGIEREQIKAYVNLLAGYEEIKIWVQFSEDKDAEYKWRVSIRSRKVDISGVASLHNGGGHANASGAKCKDDAETYKLIEELDNLL